jgi:hypothetical protein
LILADTSVWIDHLHSPDPRLSRHLDEAKVLIHPFVIGEVALGHLRRRALVINSLQDLPSVAIATNDEVLRLISEQLFGRGIGYVDAHLLAATRLTPDAKLWTHDGRLHRAALDLGLAYEP